MRNPFNRKSQKQPFSAALMAGIGFWLIVSLAGCGLIPLSEEQSVRATQLKETQLEVNTRQTLIAQQASDKQAAGTLEVQQATLNAQYTQLALGAGGATPQPPVSEANSDQATQAASQQATQAAPSPTPEPSPTVDLQSKMKTANILLFEDMTNYLDTNRYVKDTLDHMGLPYVDVGSAKGWLKEQISSGGPEGKGWDLVIIAAESKTSGEAGEYFEYVLDMIDQGTPVIFEVFYLDKVFSGSASKLLDQCGLEYEGNMIRLPANRMVMFPLDSSNPILQEPNSGLTFTDTQSFWWDDQGKTNYDTGDLVQTTMTGDARLLVGTKAEEKQTHGTLTVCMNNYLILQTFSSHNLTYNAMQPVWENYIYNALKVRFQGPG
jgi:hypothetical protein